MLKMSDVKYKNLKDDNQLLLNFGIFQLLPCICCNDVVKYSGFFKFDIIVCEDCQDNVYDAFLCDSFL